MPTYQYRCTECGNELEAVQKFTDPSLTDCPTCEGRLRKIYNAVGVVFKGSGFYRTDSRAADKAGSSSKSGSGSTSDKSSSDASGGSKSDTADKSSGSKESAGSAGSNSSNSGSTSKSSSTAGAASSS